MKARRFFLSWSRPGIAALGILLLALVVRLRWIDWGFPLKYGHIDESVVCFYALRIVSGAWNPGFYDYPGFFLYVLAGASATLSGLFQLVTGAGLGRFLALYEQGDARFFLLTARLVSVFFALLTVGGVLRWGWRRGGAGAGVIAALWLAVNPLHVLHSRYGTVDVTAAFWTLAGLLALMEAAEKGDVRTTGTAGLLIGLGTATKYYPGVLAPLLLVLSFLRRPRCLGREWAAALVGLLAGFALGSPGAWVAPGDFIGRFAHLFPKIIGGTSSAGVPPWTTAWNVVRFVGPVLLPLAIAGGIWEWRRGGLPGRVLLLGTGLLFVFISTWKVQSPHYALPLFAPLFLLAGRGVVAQTSWRRRLAVVLAAMGVLMSAGGLWRQQTWLGTPDTRLTAKAWIRDHLPPGSRILRFQHTPEFTPRDPYSVKVDFTGARLGDEMGTATFTPFDTVLYAAYNADSDTTPSRLEAAGLRRVHEVVGPAAPFPHHPRVLIYSVPHGESRP